MAFPPFYPRHERSMTKYRVFVDTESWTRSTATCRPPTRSRPTRARRRRRRRLRRRGVAKKAAFRSRTRRPSGSKRRRGTSTGRPRRSPNCSTRWPSSRRSTRSRRGGRHGVQGPVDRRRRPGKRASTSCRPRDILKRMVAGRFVRYTFNKAIHAAARRRHQRTVHAEEVGLPPATAAGEVRHVLGQGQRQVQHARDGRLREPAKPVAPVRDRPGRLELRRDRRAGRGAQDARAGQTCGPRPRSARCS